jgi:hypothetical protein
VLAVAGVLFVAGCTTPSDDTAATPPSPSSSPAADTRDSVTVVKESFQRGFAAKTFTMTARISAAGQVSADMSATADLAADTIRVALTGPAEIEMRKFGDDLLLKTGEPGEVPWLRLQISKLNATSELRNSLDLTQHSGILGGVLTAEKRDSAAGTVTYEGIADIKKAVEAAPASAKDSMEPMSRLAKNATAVPYTATVDGEGRLIELSYTVEIPLGAMLTEIKMTDLGEVVTIDRPKPDEVKDATEEQYAFF